MMKWPPDLEKIRASRAGRYLRTYMTPTVEVIRLLTLVPMAYGAWNRQWWPIGVAIVLLSLAWANGWLFPRQTKGIIEQ